jgi:hypothetical protein
MGCTVPHDSAHPHLVCRVHLLWFYKHQHDNWVRSKLFVACQWWWFHWQFAAILVNCAPSRDMHNYFTPHIIKENFENFLIHQCNYILLSQVYYVWQVGINLTIIFNNPVFSYAEHANMWCNHTILLFVFWDGTVPNHIVTCLWIWWTGQWQCLISGK